MKVKEAIENHSENDVIHYDHWGNLTGKNNYRKYSKIVILSYPFKPEHHITNQHTTSLTGLKALLTDPEGELSHETKEQRELIKRGSMTAEIIQAINRVRCRSVNDAKGNCPQTDIYMFRSTDKSLNDYIVEAISSSMTNIKVQECEDLKLPETLISSENKRTGRPTYIKDKQFIEYVSKLDKGEYKTSDIKRGANISDDVMQRISKTIISTETDTSYITDIADIEIETSDMDLNEFIQYRELKVTGKGKGRKLVVGR